MGVLEFPALGQRGQTADCDRTAGQTDSDVGEPKVVAFNLQHPYRFNAGGVPMQSTSRKRAYDPDVAPLGLIHLRYIEMFQAINAGLLAAQEPRSTQNSTPTSFEKFVQDVFVPAYHEKAHTAQTQRAGQMEERLTGNSGCGSGWSSRK